ncbi:hypothetical protein R3P38DRAFT_3283761 [Favolaschia claudopus]|uniref:Uncharacterized protein n=1 Tax=Favolaschia claudopus TaxID=2862362 RepID=A0AAW0A6R1_9AGAR
MSSNPALPPISSYPWQFPLTSQVTTALHCTNRLLFSLNVLDFALDKHSVAPTQLASKHDFWYTIFDSEQNFWLWENEEEREIGRRFFPESDAHPDGRFSAGVIDDFLAHKLQAHSKPISGLGRLSHLKSGVRIRFLAWLFIVMERELGSRQQMPIARKTNSAETFPALYRLLFKIFVPAWPSILWALFRMLRADEPEPVLTFLSLLRDERNRDLFVWDRKDQEILSWSQQNFKIGPLLLDWHRYTAEIDPQTWTTIDYLTRVKRRLSVRHEASTGGKGLGVEFMAFGRRSTGV